MTNNVVDVEINQAGQVTVDERAAIAGPPVAASPSNADDTPKRVLARNTSSTLLTIHHPEHGQSHPFPPRAVMEISQAEAQRFKAKGLISVLA